MLRAVVVLCLFLLYSVSVWSYSTTNTLAQKMQQKTTQALQVFTDLKYQKFSKQDKQFNAADQSDGKNFVIANQ